MNKKSTLRSVANDYLTHPRKSSGITLIALVVTIIVLLLLAGISIMMLSGNNGILNRASEAKEKTVIGQEKEQVELAYNSAITKKLKNYITANELQTELDAILGDTGNTDETKKKTKVTQKNNNLSVLFKETQNNYIINNGQVSKVDILSDGIYFGNVKMGGLYISALNNGNYNEYQNGFNSDSNNLRSFLEKCYSKEATNSDYNNAIEIAERVGVSKELIGYAYNNQGVRLRDVQSSNYEIEPTSNHSADVKIPFAFELYSSDENWKLDVNLDIHWEADIYDAMETNGQEEIQYGQERVMVNPESISFGYIDINQEIPAEVQLPFGMKLKHDERLITTMNEKFINDGYSQEEALELAKRTACVIDWQGKNYTYNELCEFVNNNVKIVYNGEIWNISESAKKLNELFEINSEKFVRMFREIDSEGGEIGDG